MQQIVLPAAILLGVHAALSGLAWTRSVLGERRKGRRRGMALNLARRAGPPAAAGLVLLVAGRITALPGHAPLAALVLAGALAHGFERGLAETGQSDRRSLGLRVAVTLGLGLAILWQTGLA